MHTAQKLPLRSIEIPKVLHTHRVFDTILLFLRPVLKSHNLIYIVVDSWAFFPFPWLYIFLLVFLLADSEFGKNRTGSCFLGMGFLLLEISFYLGLVLEMRILCAITTNTFVLLLTIVM